MVFFLYGKANTLDVLSFIGYLDIFFFDPTEWYFQYQRTGSDTYPLHTQCVGTRLRIRSSLLCESVSLRVAIAVSSRNRRDLIQSLVPTHSLWNTFYHAVDRASKRNYGRLLWGPWDSLRLLSRLRIWAPIKPRVNFHRCFISCAAECPDNIYFIQSSDKHNQLIQQGVTC